MFNKKYEIRQAKPTDVHAVSPLIYSAGPAAFEYGFTCKSKSAMQFIEYAFLDGQGVLGWRNHRVITENEEVVGIGAFYSDRDLLRLSFSTTLQIFKFYSLRDIAAVIFKSLKLMSLMPGPSRKMLYVANFGVRADRRSQGAGRYMLEHQRELAKSAGFKTFGLDVSCENPRAQNLYEKLGLFVVKENVFTGPAGTLPSHRRMEMPL